MNITSVIALTLLTISASAQTISKIYSPYSYHSLTKDEVLLNKELSKIDKSFFLFSKDSFLVVKGVMKGNLRTGSWIWFYTNGNIKRRLTFDKNRKVGWADHYYDSGQSESRYFIDPKKKTLEHKSLSWYKNGQLRFERNYSNDHLSGDYFKWNEKGILIFHGKYCHSSDSLTKGNDCNCLIIESDLGDTYDIIYPNQWNNEGTPTLMLVEDESNLNSFYYLEFDHIGNVTKTTRLERKPFDLTDLDTGKKSIIFLDQVKR